jgi:hypothetical protein
MDKLETGRILRTAQSNVNGRSAPVRAYFGGAAGEFKILVEQNVYMIRAG